MSYFKTMIKAGKTIEVYKSFTKRAEGKVERGQREQITPEDMEKINQDNAERKLTRLINANFGEGDYFITLTYQKDKRQTPKESKKAIKDLIDQIRKKYKKLWMPLKYIHVTEYKNKAIHHHMIINECPGLNVPKLIRELWTYGRPDFKLLDGTGQYKDLAAYLIKETAKTFKEHEDGHKQRYSCSRNLVRPVPITEVVRKAMSWSANPKPIKGYYIDQDTVYNGVNRKTGREYQRYTMISLDAEKPNWLTREQQEEWEKAKEKWNEQKLSTSKGKRCG